MLLLSLTSPSPSEAPYSSLLYSVFHQILIRCCTYHILKASATFTYTDRCRFCNILQVNLFHFLSVLSLNLFYIFCLCYALCSAFQAYCSISFLLSVYTTYMLSHLSALSQYIFCIKFPQEFHFICRKLHIFP